jgi:hypothetical protein
MGFGGQLGSHLAGRFKRETTMKDKKVPAVKKLTLADLKQVVGGAAPVKIEVESVPGGSKAKGEG